MINLIMILGKSYHSIIVDSEFDINQIFFQSIFHFVSTLCVFSCTEHIRNFVVPIQTFVHNSQFQITLKSMRHQAVELYTKVCTVDSYVQITNSFFAITQ